MARVEVTITYLEMEHPAMLRVARAPRPDVSLERVNPPAPDVAARYYNDVGRAYHWLDRAEWTAAQWNDELTRAGTELWILRVDGAEAGFFLLTLPAPRTGEILYLGLLPGRVGEGLGAHLLTSAIERAWATGADRVLVNTCSLDHPRALANYLARGFEIVRTRAEWRELPEG